MILQKDKRLIPELREAGCYFMSICFLLNKYQGTEWSPELINEFYQKVAAKGFVLADEDFTSVSDYDATIKNPEAIFVEKGLYVRYTDKHELPSRICGEDEFEILKFVHGNHTHFVVGTGCGQVAYDPWGVSDTVKYGHLDSKRIFRIL